MSDFSSKNILESFKDNPELQIFREVESLLNPNLRALILDMSLKKEILWIKVKHPSASLLLLMQKMAIMSKLKRLSNSFYVKDLKVIIASETPEVFMEEKVKDVVFSFELAPTGVVMGEGEPINNPHLKELMEALRQKIQERKD